MEMCNGYSEEDIRRRRVRAGTLSSLSLCATKEKEGERDEGKRKKGGEQRPRNQVNDLQEQLDAAASDLSKLSSAFRATD